MSNLNRKIVQPKDVLIEKTAGALAAEWYEIGRSQGLTSKYKDAKAYAKANLEKFIPNAISILMDMLNRPDVSESMKETIYDAFMERANDPSNLTSTDFALPNVDIKKVIENSNLPPPPSQALKPVREKPINIRTRLKNSTAL